MRDVALTGSIDRMNAIRSFAAMSLLCACMPEGPDAPFPDAPFPDAPFPDAPFPDAPFPGPAAPYAAALQGASVTLAFAGDRTCIIDAPAGTAPLAPWWDEPRDCPGVAFVEVQFLAPSDGTAILVAPTFDGPLVVPALPPGSASARVVVTGDAGLGWFEGRPD